MLKMVAPYSKIAPFYDKIMEHVNYKKWAKYIKTIFAFYHRRPTRIIDLSCGTGSILPHLYSKSWELFGADYSLPMLELAQSKVSAQTVPLFCSDFKKLPFKANQFDAVLVLYDSINYLLETTQINLFFKEAYYILKTQGLLIFDAVSPYICRKAFSDYHEEHFWGKVGYERKAWYVPEQAMQYNEFRIFLELTEYQELHQQKIRSIDEWKQLLELSSFDLLANFSNFSLRKAHGRSERVHFVCAKN